MLNLSWISVLKEKDRGSYRPMKLDREQPKVLA
jgi:hypothetical protein